ncbi:response regulator [Spirulina subsalsa FACHB-351]|uniref:Response regulator n=1 Tax=Spirulina subsalsa FACHB-351 TaxID=234711 RepID=A0ABT3L198_9CYAN|nr:response regulator [Spirulina subsalsa]MCW6035279.1 response regulator [Spirulina subsalsa FACHB-351]
MRILLIEDDETLAELLTETLISNYYLVDHATDGQTGWDLAEAFEYDLILLDFLVPQMNGLEFCQELRKKGDRTPILLMTGDQSQTRKVAILDAGADDYLTKPFNLEELLARVRALLRRGNDIALPVIEWGELHLDPSSCIVTFQGQPLRLTAKEYQMLDLFLRNPERIFSQSALLDNLWSFDDPPSENAVRTQIKSLRQKLKRAGAGDVIETLYGLGYRLKTPDAVSPQPPAPPKPNSTPPANSMPSYMVKIWERNRDKYDQRIDIIEQAIAALQINPDDGEWRDKSKREAHTLAGSLGSFGLHGASEQARVIEQYLQATPLNLPQLSLAVNHLRQLLHPTPQTSPPSRIASPSVPLREKASLLIVDHDVALTEVLSQEAQQWGITVRTAYSVEQARDAIAQAKPDIILLDLNFPQAPGAGFELLTELAPPKSKIPIVVFSAREDFDHRLKVARLGGQGFLQKPLSPFHVLGTLQQVLHQSKATVATLMIVDDDPELLECLEVILKPWGFTLILLDNPKTFWDVLKQSHPDLLILDVQMPQISGIELCQVLRNDPQWYTIPILILSAHRDSDTIQQVFMAGADDYIQKPIVEPELIARILNRLERSQLQRRVAISGKQ